MKKNTKGFTLIELLAVIVILGIIAVIAVPIVKNITKDAKKKSFMESARGIIRAGDLYYSKKDMKDEIDGDITFEFPNGASELNVSGKLPKSGSMIINEDGDVALAISNGKYCATKNFEDKDITVTEDAESCELPEGSISGDAGNQDGDVIKEKTVTINDELSFVKILSYDSTTGTLVIEYNSEFMASISSIETTFNDNSITVTNVGDLQYSFIADEVGQYKVIATGVSVSGLNPTITNIVTVSFID